MFTNLVQQIEEEYLLLTRKRWDWVRKELLAVRSLTKKVLHHKFWRTIWVFRSLLALLRKTLLKKTIKFRLKPQLNTSLSSTKQEVMSKKKVLSQASISGSTPNQKLPRSLKKCMTAWEVTILLWVSLHTEMYSESCRKFKTQVPCIQKFPTLL